MVVSRLCFQRGNWLVAEHTPGEQDTMSGWTNRISAAFHYRKKYADTQHTSTQHARLLDVRGQQGSNFAWWWAERIQLQEEPSTRQQLWLVQHKWYNHQKANMVVWQLYFQRANWVVGAVRKKAFQQANRHGPSRKEKGKKGTNKEAILIPTAQRMQPRKGQHGEKPTWLHRWLYFQRANWAVQANKGKLSGPSTKMKGENNAAAGRTSGESNAQRHQIAIHGTSPARDPSGPPRTPPCFAYSQLFPGRCSPDPLLLSHTLTTFATDTASGWLLILL